MSAKTSAARRAAFFTALAETGNQTISAGRRPSRLDSRAFSPRWSR